MNIFAQDTGNWHDGTGELIGKGYAGGNKGNDPEGVNNPAMQELPCVGPLPCGFYKIGKPYTHPKCGEYFLPLTPNPTNQMFGRGGFGIHGDEIAAAGQKKASDGCIILALGVRQQIGEKLAVDDDLQVVTTYDPLAKGDSGTTGGNAIFPTDHLPIGSS